MDGVKMKKLLDLFITFFKIGLFTFGGGYAMISILENECVNKHNWISKDTMNEVVILSESTPGPIAINASTFIGYQVGKVIGSLVSTIAVSLPSLIIIILISIFLNAFKGNVFIEFLFQGVRASVIILMLLAFFNLFKRSKKNALFYSLLTLSFILNFFFNVKSIYIIIFAIIFSFIYLLMYKSKEVNKNA
jgi:chromate transporter